MNINIKRFLRSQLFFLTVFCGCNLSMGPIGSFEETIASLIEPKQASAWLNNCIHVNITNTEINSKYDWVERNARALFQSRRGSCSQLSCWVVYCARIHGYTCGTLFSTDGIFSHERGWIIENDGSVSIVSNFNYFKSRWPSFDKMILGVSSEEKGSHTWRDERGDKLLAYFPGI